MKNALKIFLCLSVFLAITSIGLFHKTHLNNNNGQCVAGRGCCSHHQGVCGCRNGRTQCCDGTQSPSCRCFRDDVKGLEI